MGTMRKSLRIVSTNCLNRQRGKGNPLQSPLKLRGEERGLCSMRVYVLLVALCVFLLLGCAAKVPIQTGNPNVVKMKMGASHTATADGWFVTDEAVAEMLMAVEYYRWKWMECENAK
jgi:hypothetical protein